MVAVARGTFLASSSIPQTCSGQIRIQSKAYLIMHTSAPTDIYTAPVKYANQFRGAN